MPQRLTAVILAAGKGTRMNDPTRAKVLFDVGGAPMIDHVVEQARSSGADRIVVIIGHGRDAVRAHLSRKFGSGILFAEQIEQHGTGHAVQQAIPLLREREDTTLVLSGDVPLLTEKTIRALIAHHVATGSTATVLSVDAPDPTGYGRVVRNRDGSVDRIVEHRDATAQEREIVEINSGIYAFATPELIAALDHLRPDNAQGEYYLTDVFAWLRQQGRAIGVWKTASYEEVHGINTREQLALADATFRQRV